jgi:hypothetical protein
MRTLARQHARRVHAGWWLKRFLGGDCHIGALRLRETDQRQRRDENDNDKNVHDGCHLWQSACVAEKKPPSWFFLHDQSDLRIMVNVMNINYYLLVQHQEETNNAKPNLCLLNDFFCSRTFHRSN